MEVLIEWGEEIRGAAGAAVDKIELPWCRNNEADVPGGGGGALPYMGHIGMCRCEGYGFQAVYSSIGYINQSVWV